jgi:hypothetical protein
MYDAEQRMKEIMEAPRSKLYSDQLNRFLTFKNKMAHSSPGIPETSAQSNPQAPAEMPQPNEPVEITPRVPATPKPNFLTPPPRRQPADNLVPRAFEERCEGQLRPW